MNSKMMLRFTSCIFLMFFSLELFAQGSTCANATNIATLPYNATNQTTCGKGREYGNACRLNDRYTAGEDGVYKLTAAKDACIQINITRTGTFPSMGVSVFDGCPSDAGSTCRQAAASAGAISFNVKLTAGKTYYIIVDAGEFGTNSCIEKFDINVDYIPCPPPELTGKEGGIDCGGNMGFELGNSSGWKGAYNNDNSKYSGPPINPPIMAFKPANPGLNGTLGACGVGAGSNNTQTARHTITSGNGKDPNTGNQLPVVAPGAGNYSFRLGNQEPNAGAECVEITFKPTPATPIFTYLYAIVSNDNPDHPPDEKSRFEMSLKDQSGAVLPCGGRYTITSGAREDDGFIESTTACDAGNNGAEVWWSPWRAVSIDLSDYIGQNLTIKFCTADCSRDGHYTYAYLDGFCFAKEIKGTTVCSTGDPVTLTAPIGFANYTWYKGQYDPGATSIGTGPTYTITNPADGDVYTVVYENFQGMCPIKLYATDTIKVFSMTTDGDTTVCNDATGTLKISANASDPSATYKWSPATNLSCTDCASPEVTLPLAATTTYTVTVDGPLDCKLTKAVKITVIPCGTSVTASGGAICPDQCTTIHATPNGGSPPYTYTWSPGNLTGASHKVCPTSTTTYSVVLTDSSGFTASATAVVTVNPTPDIIASATPICAGNSSTLTALGDVGTTYAWSAGTTPSTGAVVTATPTTATTYTVLGTNPYGCTNTTTATVIIDQIPIITVDKGFICAGQELTLTASGGETYSWSTGDKTKSIKVSPTSTTSYTVVGASKAGCTNSAVSIVTVYPSPKADFTANPQPTTILSPKITFKDLSWGAPIAWDWTFWDHTKDTVVKSSVQHPPVYTYTDTGTYKVKLIIVNQYGCKDSITKYVVIGPEWSFYIPNTFTPNNDTKNDGFIGKSWNVIEHQMWIFDRWGNMVYTTGKTKDPESAIPWDGKANKGAEVAQIDTYVWLVILKDIFGNKHKLIGHVNLIR